MKLAEPYPSSPTLPPKHGFYIRKDGAILAFHNFAATYAAKRFLDSLLSTREHTWSSDDTILIPDINVTITGERTTDLDKIMEYELSSAEAAHRLSPNERSSIAKITGDAPDDDIPDATPTVTAKTERKRRQRAPKAAASANADTCTPATLSEALSTSPKSIRDALRKSPLVKPTSGWSWPLSELDTIADTIRPFLKEKPK